jgi:hypothetical protein
MAKKDTPYRFMVDGVKFDVTFDYCYIGLEYNAKRHSYITIAFARKVGTVETLAAKSILNPNDIHNEIIGQRNAFKKLMEVVWAFWTDCTVDPRIFVQHARDCAYMAGLWNTDED